jgi:hypothetical protein
MQDSGKMMAGAGQQRDAPLKIGNFTPKTGFRSGKISESQYRFIQPWSGRIQAPTLFNPL